MMRIVFKPEDCAARLPQEHAFTHYTRGQPANLGELGPVLTAAQYVDAIVDTAPEGVPLVGRMDEPGIWVVEPPFPMPHHFGGWEPRPSEEL